jgi:hypothetical protein
MLHIQKKPDFSLSSLLLPQAFLLFVNSGSILPATHTWIYGAILDTLLSSHIQMATTSVTNDFQIYLESDHLSLPPLLLLSSSNVTFLSLPTFFPVLYVYMSVCYWLLNSGPQTCVASGKCSTT